MIRLDESGPYGEDVRRADFNDQLKLYVGELVVAVLLVLWSLLS